MKEKIKMTLIKAPTGAGKTRSALLGSRNNETIIAVPTIEQMKELHGDAVKLGLKPVVITGKGNYPCGRKVRESRGLSDSGTVSLLAAKSSYELITEFNKNELGNHFECCDEDECPVNIYESEKERIIKERPHLIITTHAFLKIAGYKSVLPAEYKLVLDEADIFFSVFCDPFPPYNAFRLNELKTLVSVKSKAQIEKIKEKMLQFGKYSKPIAHNCKGGVIRKFEMFDGFIDEIAEIISSEGAVFLGMGKKKLKHAAMKKREYLNTAAGITRNMLNPREGMYSYIAFFKPDSANFASKKTYTETCDVSLKISLDVFSESYKQNYFACLKALAPKSITALSASMPQYIEDKLKFYHDVTEKKLPDKVMEERFRGSRLNVFVEAEEYKYSRKDDYMDYAFSFIKKYGSLSTKAKVILATSVEQVERLSLKFADEGYNVISKQANRLVDESGDTVQMLNKFNMGNGTKDVLIVATGLWRGLNITRDSDFYMLKLPFESPDAPKNTAIRDIKYISRKTGRLTDSSLSMSFNNAMSKIVQGVGRVIRGPGQIRNLYVLDNRLLTNKRIGLGWLFSQAYYEICPILLPLTKKNKRRLHA